MHRLTTVGCALAAIGLRIAARAGNAIALSAAAALFGPVCRKPKFARGAH